MQRSILEVYVYMYMIYKKKILFFFLSFFFMMEEKDTRCYQYYHENFGKKLSGIKISNRLLENSQIR